MITSTAALNADHSNTRCPCCDKTGGPLRKLHSLPAFDGQDHAVVGCMTCNFRFMAPAPQPTWLEAYYKSRALYDADSAFAQDYANSIADKEQFVEQMLQQYLSGPRLEKLAIDFGAGSGYVVKAMKNRGFKAFGLELNPQAPAKAQALFGVEVRIGGINTLADSSVSVFSLFEVLEHMPDPVHFLRHVRSKLCKDSLLIGSVPNYQGLGRFIFGINSSVLIVPEHLVYFDIPTLKCVLQQAGYEPLLVGFKKPNQVLLNLGLRQLIYKKLGRTWLSRCLVTLITRFKKHMAYPLLNRFVERTGLLGHGLTFVARPINR